MRKGEVMDRQVKTKQRVADHGEVFTAKREVEAMCALVEDECLRIDSRFLEPACGEGNFLWEILGRKLDVVIKRYGKAPYDYERNALLALGSLYGVELLLDNVLACRERLYGLWNQKYEKTVAKRERNEEVRKSARYILEHNIICGNALNLCCVDDRGEDTDRPIIFSQWAFATGPMMKREDYTFAQLLEGEGTLVKAYPPIHYRRLKEYG